MRPFSIPAGLLLLLSCASDKPPTRPVIFPDLGERAQLLPPGGRSDRPVVTEELYRGLSQNSSLVRVERPIPLHVHQHSEESVYILQGSGILHLVDEEELPVSAGDLVIVPRGVAHGYTPDDGEASLVLSIFSPPLRDDDRQRVDERD